MNPSSPSERHQPHRFRGSCTGAEPPRVESEQTLCCCLPHFASERLPSCLCTGIPRLGSAASNSRRSGRREPDSIRPSPPSLARSTPCVGLRARRVFQVRRDRLRFVTKDSGLAPSTEARTPFAWCTRPWWRDSAGVTTPCSTAAGRRCARGLCCCRHHVSCELESSPVKGVTM